MRFLEFWAAAVSDASRQGVGGWLAGQRTLCELPRHDGGTSAGGGMWWCLSSLDRRLYVETGIELTGANRCKAEVLRDLWSS
jgi:hypothetical protein